MFGRMVGFEKMGVSAFEAWYNGALGALEVISGVFWKISTKSTGRHRKVNSSKDAKFYASFIFSL